LIINWKQ